jgi:phosphoribosyl 1,2-cyclic phosphodiesterase
MALFISSINSGSNGNCYYIGNEKDAILVDAGISCRETERRMKRLGLPMERLRAIFISHEHSDHINGLSVLSRKYQLPVYITAATQRLGRLHLEKKLVRRFEANKPVNIGELSVTAFQKEHDAGDPHSFVISASSVNIGVFTDIGIVCKEVVHHFKQCHAAFLETNYDAEMLMKGSYPHHLKKRISNGKGHLSNHQALELFIRHRPAFMSHLILSHLSQNNNRPELVDALFQPHSKGMSIVVASRHKETAVFAVESNHAPVRMVQSKRTRPRQLSLFH